jgi:hypothetical protein
MDELTEIFTRDVPRGALISGVHETVIPARTWIKLGDADGTEIYLDVDESVRALVRTVRTTGHTRPPHQEDCPALLDPLGPCACEPPERYGDE